MSGKKIAIIYKSLTGNTRQVAEAIRDALGGEEIVYFGEPKPDIVADLYFVGSWTDKGSCDGTVGEYLKQLEGKKLAVFGTAGYGGSREYYQKLACRVTECVPDTSEVLGSFYCQGKMPIGVRNRYVAMLREHPEDQKLNASVKNFDEALSHPDEKDFADASRQVWRYRRKGSDRRIWRACLKTGGRGRANCRISEWCTGWISRYPE